jgi:ribosome modulation factor
VSGPALIRVWERGRDAALAGRPAHACPAYLAGLNREAWRNGYAAGAQDLAARPAPGAPQRAAA